MNAIECQVEATQQPGTSSHALIANPWHIPTKNSGKSFATRSYMPQGRQSIEPHHQRDAQIYSAQADPDFGKIRRPPNRFQPLAEDYNQESGRGSDKLKEGSGLDTSGFRDNRLTEPMTLTP